MAAESLIFRLSKPLKRVLPRRFRADVPVVAVVRLAGVIGGASPFRAGLTLSGLAGTLEAAFKTSRAKAVALVVNSPGGSAVQSHLIFARIRSLAEEHKLPVYAFAEDAAASGGYMIAAAADEIFADPSSIVGSIGVVAAGFGFDRLIERFGIDRRVYTAGDDKVILDPFRPEKQEDVERLTRIQRAVHIHFIDLVKSRRGGKLKGDDGDLFNGAFWSGREAADLGLIDGVGDLRAVMRERYGKDVVLKVVEKSRSFFLRRLFRTDAGSRIDAGAVLASLEERALWGRYGL
jgi:signal peptide peptidase SppA